MEITQSILVAIMFVMILSIGIASLLMGMATMVNRSSECKTYALHTSWVVLLLLVYFNLFWQTLAVFAIEDWMFRDFLYVIAGPILILFATNLLVPDFASGESSDLRTHYFGVSRQFFSLLALSQVWAIGTDFVLRRGVTWAGGFNLVFMGLALILAFSKEPKTHGLVSGVIWLLFFVSLTLRSLEIIP